MIGLNGHDGSTHTHTHRHKNSEFGSASWRWIGHGSLGIIWERQSQQLAPWSKCGFYAAWLPVWWLSIAWPWLSAWLCASLPWRIRGLIMPSTLVIDLCVTQGYQNHVVCPLTQWLEKESPLDFRSGTCSQLQPGGSPQCPTVSCSVLEQYAEPLIH